MSDPKPVRRILASRLKREKSCGLALKRVHSSVSEGMYIYLITNRANGKKYIGKTERQNPSRRWNEQRKTAEKVAKMSSVEL